MARHALRLAQLDDVAAVNRLLAEAGFKTRSRAGWQWLFQDSPAAPPDPAMGWVLVDGQGGVQGYLGNIHLGYVMDGAPLRVATSTAYCVRPAARGDSTALMRAFFKQPGPELFLSTTANAASAPIYEMFKALPPEDDSFQAGCAWVAHDRVALRGQLAARSAPLPGLLAAAAAPGARLVRCLSRLARVPRCRLSRAVEVLPPAAIDDARFDALWAQLRGRPGLQVRRDAAGLRWLLADPDVDGEIVVFTLEDGAGLRGYLAAARHRPAAPRAPELRVLDVALRPGEGEAEVIAALLRRAVEHGRAVGAGLVYAGPCGAALAARLRALGPRLHPTGRTTHFLRAAKRKQTARYAAAGVWAASGLDGDTPFCVEAAPERPR